VPRAQTSKRRAQRGVGGDLDLGPALLETIAQFFTTRAGRRCHDDDRPGVRCREHPRLRRGPQLAVEDHPHQRPFAIGPACGQQRIVGQDRSDPDANGVDFGAHALGVAVGLRRSEHGPTPGRLRNAPIHAGRGLQRDERPPLAHEREERLIEPRRHCRAEADLDGDAVGLQERESLAPYQRIGILYGGHDTRDSRLDDPGDARRGPPDVTAGFKRAVQSAAPGAGASPVERAHLGVMVTCALVMSLADHDSVGRHHDCANHRIGAGSSSTPGGMK